MKITFLGTSHGVPDKGRFCQSILIESGGAAYLVDAGAPVIDLLIRKDFDLTKLKTVFITHMHGDHIDGLLSLVDLCSWYFKDTDFDIYLTEKEGIQCFENMLNMIFKNAFKFPKKRLRFKLMQNDFVYDDGNIKVTPVPTGHLSKQNRPAFGYIIEGEGKKVYITGDLNGEMIDYSDIVNREKIDAFVIECAHFTAERLIEKMKRCVAKRVMIIHGYRPEIVNVFAEFKDTKPKFELLYPSDGDEYII